MSRDLHGRAAQLLHRCLDAVTTLELPAARWMLAQTTRALKANRSLVQAFRVLQHLLGGAIGNGRQQQGADFDFNHSWPPQFAAAWAARKATGGGLVAYKKAAEAAAAVAAKTTTTTTTTMVVAAADNNNNNNNLSGAAMDWSNQAAQGVVNANISSLLPTLNQHSQQMDEFKKAGVTAPKDFMNSWAALRAQYVQLVKHHCDPDSIQQLLSLQGFSATADKEVAPNNATTASASETTGI